MELRPGRAGSPTGQVMSLPCGAGQPRGGAAAGPARALPAPGCHERECSKVIILVRPAYDRRRGTAIGAPVPRGILIGLAVRFTGWSADPVPMQWLAIPCRPLIVGGVIMRVFCRIAARGWPADPPGRGPGPLWAARPGFLVAAREATPSVREPTTTAILVSSPAFCCGRHHERVSVQATAMLGKYSLDHARQSGLDSAGPLFGRAGDSCQPATFWRACASVCWRSRYPMLLAPKVCVSTVVRLLNLVEGTAPCRDPDGSANSSQCWAPTGPPKKNRAGHD